MIYDVKRLRGSGCDCHEPKLASVVAEQATRMTVKRSAHKRPATMAEEAAHKKAGATPILMTAGKGSLCRPFYKIEKDPDKFAACNALSDEIGPLDDPKKAYKLIEEAIGDEFNEVFGLVTLDIHCRMKSIAETGRGEADSVMAPLKPTLQTALIDGAHGVIIFHVHPSGVEAEPSDADIETTQSFVEAFEAIDVLLVDHIIIGGDIKKRSYYSFREDGAL